jgi:hypothetical protein
MADQNDPTQNVTIWNNAKGKNVDVITDGAIERLAVDATATIVNDESPTRYQLKTEFDATGVTVTSAADVVLDSYTGDGVYAFFACSAGSSGYEITIEIDGTERIRITMQELNDIGLANATNVPLWAETANKNFRYHPSPEIGFTTGFRILAKATSANVLIKYLSMYKEKI